jgi:hypothetical protein
MSHPANTKNQPACVEPLRTSRVQTTGFDCFAVSSPVNLVPFAGAGPPSRNDSTEPSLPYVRFNILDARRERRGEQTNMAIVGEGGRPPVPKTRGRTNGTPNRATAVLKQNLQPSAAIPNIPPSCSDSSLKKRSSDPMTVSESALRGVGARVGLKKRQGRCKITKEATYVNQR